MGEPAPQAAQLPRPRSACAFPKPLRHFQGAVVANLYGWPPWIDSQRLQPCPPRTLVMPASKAGATRPCRVYGWNCFPLITMRLRGAVGLELPKNATGFPFFAGMASISTSSPGLNVFLVQ